MVCVYTFPNGDVVRGKPALKAYLTQNLADLLPERAIAAGIRQAMAAPMSRTENKGGQKIADTFRLASTILDRFSNPPNLEIVETIDDPRVPQEVRDEAARQKKGGAKGEPEGFYFKGTVYLVNGSLKTPKDVARVLFHETLGHYGLRGLYGDALNPILDEIVQRRKADVTAKAKSYGLKVNSPDDMRTAAEEVLAEMAQTRPEIGFVKRAIAAIRTWLRDNVPGFANLDLSDAEIIRDYIAPARAFVQQGEQAGRDMAAPALSRAAARQTFYSQLARAFEGAKQDSMPGTQWAAWLDSNAAKMQVKADEIQWTGINDWLALKGKEKVSKADIANYLGQNGVQVEEVMKDAPYERGELDSLLDQWAMRNAGATADAINSGESWERTRKIAEREGDTEVVRMIDRRDSPVKYASYVLPGGENYRELLLTLPAKDGAPVQSAEARRDQAVQKWAGADADTYAGLSDAKKATFESLFGDLKAFERRAKREARPVDSFKSSHWDELNVLAHVRFNDRTDADGNRVLFIEELQSDWGQAGRKQGFNTSTVSDARLRELIEQNDQNADTEGLSRADLLEMARVSNLEIGPIPAAPFITNDSWIPLSVKRVISYAVENGYDKVAFITGQQAFERFPKGQDGKSTEKGMKTNYDVKIPSAVNDVLKKVGGGKMYELSGSATSAMSVERQDDSFIVMSGEKTIAGPFATRADALRVMREKENAGGVLPSGQLGFEITPAMREKVSQGVPLFSRAKPAVNPVEDTSLTPPEPNMLRRVQEVMQDNMNRVNAVQARIEKLTGEKMPEVSNYYGAEANRPGRIAARLEDVRDKMTKPLVKRLVASGYTMPQLSELLHAQHAQERNEAVERINPDVTDGSGMSTEKANAILAKYKGERELLRIADDARKMARATLDLKLAYGQIDEETYNALTTRYERYVPLKGDGEYGPKIKRAMGHEERDEFILENIARDYDQAVVTGEKNLARQSLLAMTLENPDPELWTVGVAPKGRYVAGYSYRVMKDGKEVAVYSSMAQVTAFLENFGRGGGYEVLDQSGERVKSFVKPLQDNEVPVYVDGQLIRIQIKDDVLARQLRPLDQGRMNPILEGMRSMTRYLSIIYTGYNPYFILRNLARDVLTGTINITGNEGAMMLARAWKNYPAAFAALGYWASTKKIPNTEAGKYLAEYRDSGGKVGASWMGDLERQAKDLQRIYDDAYGAKGYLKDGRVDKAALIAGRKTVGGLARVIEIANQAAENSLRLALFMAMRQQGVKMSEAARAAKTVTVDFDRKGSMTGALGAIYLFFNPAVQGTANALRTLAKGKHRKQAWTALAGLAMLGFYAATAGLDDDEDRWLGEKWDVRSKTLILNAGDYTIRVPMSLEFAPFYALGVAMGEVSRGASTKVATAGRMMTAFLNAYFPLTGIYDYDSDNHMMDVAQAVTPTVARPFVELATNRNAFGGEIVPESDFTKNKPDNLKMYRGTKNTVYDRAAQAAAAMGEVLGAGRYENDLSKVSPETLKYLWRTYTGGIGTFMADTINVGTTAIEGSELETNETPFVKDFLRKNDVRPIRGRWYEVANEATKAMDEFKQAKKAGDGEAMDKFLEDPEKSAVLGLDKLIRKTNEAVAAIRDEAVDINADKTLTPAEKKAKLKELEKAEEELYRNGLEVFKSDTQ